MNARNTKFIVFSGGCCSGKTTTMGVAKEIFEKQGMEVIMLNEIVRRHAINSIEDLRKDGKSYLNFQYSIIHEKMKQELSLYAENKKCIVLCDRAISDSLFYLTFYTDKSSLDRNSFAMFACLQRDIYKHAELAFGQLYTQLLEFKPLKLHIEQEYDLYRPKNIDIIKHIEAENIFTINNSFVKDTNGKCMRVKIDLNKSGELQRVHKILYNTALLIKEQWEQLI
jgi:hypothetical protein